MMCSNIGSGTGTYSSQQNEIRRNFPYNENRNQLQKRVSEIETELQTAKTRKQLLSVANQVSSLRNFSIPMQRGAREALRESSAYLDRAEKSLARIEEEIMRKLNRRR